MTTIAGRRHARGLLALIGAAAGLALAVAHGCGARPPADPLQAQAREHGIEVLGVQLTGNGNFARLNYRVVDYDKAKHALKGEVRLGAEGSDRALAVTSTGRLGPLRQRPAAGGRIQFMLFTNSGGGLKKGDRAYLAIGDRRIDGIPVT